MLSAVRGRERERERETLGYITDYQRYEQCKTSERLARYARLVAARTMNGSQLIRVNDIYFVAFSTYRAYWPRSAHPTVQIERWRALTNGHANNSRPVIPRNVAIGESKNSQTHVQMSRAIFQNAR